MITDVLSFNPYLYLLLPAVFLLGSVPFGLVFTRHRGVDVRRTGSKNIGATNVLRSAGKIPALLTLAADLLKGAVPVYITALVVGELTAGHPVEQFRSLSQDIWCGLVGMTAVLGHMFSIFLKCRGGKGVATGFGVLIAYSPISAAIVLFIWIMVVSITKYVSLGGIVAVCLLPLVYLMQEASGVKVIFASFLALLITIKHSSNVKKLFAGTEAKIGGKSASGSKE